MVHLQTIQDIEQLIRNDSWMMDTLRMADALNLSDWFIGAGFIRNKVWDLLHGYERPVPLGDIDVIYFDPFQADVFMEEALEQTLYQRSPIRPWSVKNQARMHVPNGDSPYQSSLDALSKWPETATCIAARLERHEQVRVVAPHGIQDLLSLCVRPTPHFLFKPEQYLKRLAKKQWAANWPKLTFEDM